MVPPIMNRECLGSTLPAMTRNKYLVEVNPVPVRAEGREVQREPVVRAPAPRAEVS
jgi:hypothetical protein